MVEELDPLGADGDGSDKDEKEEICAEIIDKLVVSEVVNVIDNHLMPNAGSHPV